MAAGADWQTQVDQLIASGEFKKAEKVMDKLSGGIQFLGGVLIVMGLVNLGMALREGAHVERCLSPGRRAPRARRPSSVLRICPRSLPQRHAAPFPCPL